jgi:hypothetical protein
LAVWAYCLAWLPLESLVARFMRRGVEGYEARNARHLHLVEHPVMRQ